MSKQMPNWEGFMLPTLQVLSDNKIKHRRELQPLIAREIGLTEAQRKELLPSGNQLRWVNRLGWAISYLANVGALDRAKRGHYIITEAGQELLTQFSTGVQERDLKLLGMDPNSKIRAYQKAERTSAKTASEQQVEAELTPIEQVQDGIDRITTEVADELLSRLQEKDPEFFEDAVVRLLLAMGYGGTNGAGSVTKLTNDGGIDGVIDQDILGLSRVYIQAKRYGGTNKVGRPDVQGFVGALSGKADSGVFITTSRFSDGAKSYAASVPTRIILIDGARLTELMIRFGVGVQTKDVYQVVEIDEDFFD